MNLKLEKTNAIRQLDQKRIPYTVHHYEGGALSGVDVAAQLRQPVERVFKTLVTVGKSGEHYVFMLPVAQELDLKKGAACVGEKALSMLPQKDLLPLTGYVHGGCSPIGMKKQLPTIIHASVTPTDIICFSAGKIGMQIETQIALLQKVIPLKFFDVSKEEHTV